MDQTELLRRLRALRPRLQAGGVRHLTLFGSRARGDHRPDSDIDLLVEVDESQKFSLLDLIGVEHVVSDEIGIPAHATMRRSLRDTLKASIEPEIVDIF